MTAHLGLSARRIVAVVALLAGLAAAGLTGGHALASVSGHLGEEHGEVSHRQHDDDGVVFGPLPGPIAPPAPGR